MPNPLGDSFRALNVVNKVKILHMQCRGSMQKIKEYFDRTSGLYDEAYREEYALQTMDNPKLQKYAQRRKQFYDMHAVYMKIGQYAENTNQSITRKGKLIIRTVIQMGARMEKISAILKSPKYSHEKLFVDSQWTKRETKFWISSRDVFDINGWVDL